MIKLLKIFINITKCDCMLLIDNDICVYQVINDNSLSMYICDI